MYTCGQIWNHVFVTTQNLTQNSNCKTNEVMQNPIKIKPSLMYILPIFFKFSQLRRYYSKPIKEHVDYRVVFPKYLL